MGEDSNSSGIWLNKKIGAKLFLMQHKDSEGQFKVFGGEGCYHVIFINCSILEEKVVVSHAGQKRHRIILSDEENDEPPSNNKKIKILDDTDSE